MTLIATWKGTYCYLSVLSFQGYYSKQVELLKAHVVRFQEHDDPNRSNLNYCIMVETTWPKSECISHFKPCRSFHTFLHYDSSADRKKKSNLLLWQDLESIARSISGKGLLQYSIIAYFQSTIKCREGEGGLKSSRDCATS